MEKGKLRLKFPFSDLKSNCLVLMQEKNNLAEDLPRKSKIYIPGPVSSFKTIELRYFDVLLKGNYDFELLGVHPRFSEPQFSEIIDLMNKLQLPFSYFTLYPDSIL